MATTVPKGLPEFSLAGKVVVVSGAGRGLGLVQAEALLEAGAIGNYSLPITCPIAESSPPPVYALDLHETPAADFPTIQERAKNELGTALHYRRVDVREVEALNKIIEAIGTEHGRLDGLIAAAGINYEAPAIDYSKEEANRMLEINVTGCFLTAQAVARQMMKFGNGGSIALIASMSAHIANRVCMYSHGCRRTVAPTCWEEIAD